MQRETLGGLKKVEVQPIPKSWFKSIEEATNIKLTMKQKIKLSYPNEELEMSEKEKKQVWAISTALSIGEPLTIDEAIGEPNLSQIEKYGKYFKFYMEIAMSLQEAGFDTRQVAGLGGWKIK